VQIWQLTFFKAMATEPKQAIFVPTMHSKGGGLWWGKAISSSAKTWQDGTWEVDHGGWVRVSF